MNGYLLWLRKNPRGIFLSFILMEVETPFRICYHSVCIPHIFLYCCLLARLCNYVTLCDFFHRLICKSLIELERN